jgi:small nuclear ribonucleoprotein (snRNP)-like protein
MKRNNVFNPILSRMLGERIHINLRDDGVSVEGRLVSFDEKMNLVLEEAEGIFDGHPTVRYGRLIVRGSSIVSIYRASRF